MNIAHLFAISAVAISFIAAYADHTVEVSIWSAAAMILAAIGEVKR